MGATAMLAGTVISAGSKMYGGMKTQQADQYAAAQLGQEAGQSAASGIQGAINDRMRASYIASSARARTAASGLTTTGTSAMTNTARILSEGEYRANTSLYQGYDRSQEIGYRGQTFANQGQAAETAGWMGGLSSVLSGASNFYSKYGT